LPAPYFHLVFTLPHDLNSLANCDARTLYALLFGAVANTLHEFAANPRWLGGTPSFTLVLHTWKQDLGRHIHVHALVAGGALTADGQWVSAKRGFLFPVRALSRAFRGKFMSALNAARRALHHDAAQCDAAWRDLFATLRRHDWVVYAKQPLGGPAQVLEYLGRYTHRVAISNERILGMDAGVVRFRVRDSANGNVKRTVCLAANEFIGRFLLHVLPNGFKRIRPLRLARSCAQGGPSGCGARRVAGAHARSARAGVGGGVPAARSAHRVLALSALPHWALRGGGSDPADATISTATGAAVSNAFPLFQVRRRLGVGTRRGRARPCGLERRPMQPYDWHFYAGAAHSVAWRHAFPPHTAPALHDSRLTSIPATLQSP